MANHRSINSSSSINSSISRRDFLAGLAALGILGQQQLEALASQIDSASSSSVSQRSILVIQLNGGNDGINTIIPYGNGAYYDARPKIAIKQADVLHIDDEVGFHPSLTAFQEFYKQGKLAVIQGVGYPEPNRSHFRSIEIWQTAQPDIIGDTGWLGRYLDYLSISQSSSVFLGGRDKVMRASIEPGKEKIAMLAVNVDPILPKSLLARKVAVPSVSDVQAFRFNVDPLCQADRALQLEAFNDIYNNFEDSRPVVKKLRTSGLEANRASERLLDLVKGHKATVSYPDNKLGSSLKFIAQMVSGGIGAKVYTLGYDGFDSHAGMRTQTNLLASLGKSLNAFQEDLKQHGCDDKVMVLIFSEFGRRVAENGGGGTDHGTAGPCFVLGGGVKGGLYGQYPSLTELDHGDLKFNVDFRTVYATILDRWLGADSREVLGKNFDNLDFC